VIALNSLVALNDPRGFGLSPPEIAGIARSHAAAVRDWLAGCVTPPEPAALRLSVAVLALRKLTAISPRTHELAERVALSALAARHASRLEASQPARQ
jgi:hypothetical protein